MKRIIALLAAVVLAALTLTACGKEYIPERLSTDVIGMVSATNSEVDKLYVVEDKEAVKELVAIYNALSFTDLEGGADPEMMSRKVYCLTFYNTKGEKQASCYLAPDGYIKMDNSLNDTYRLVNGFDEEKLNKLLEENNKYNKK